MRDNQLLNVSQLTSEDIAQLFQIFKKKYKGCIAINANQGSHFDQKSLFYSKYRWDADKGVLQMEFDRPVEILDLEMECSIEIKRALLKDQNECKCHWSQNVRQTLTSTSPNSCCAPGQAQLAPLQQPLGADNLGLPVFRSPDQMQPQASESVSQRPLAYLPLQVACFRGSAYNLKNVLCKIFINNKQPFITNYANSSFTFSHLHDKKMIIEAVTIESPLQMIQGGYPIGSGLIFTANNRSFFDIGDEVYNNMTHREYKIWLHGRRAQSSSLEYWEPVGSFELKGSQQIITFSLDYVRPAKYVHLKPTNFRQEPTNYSRFFKEHPLEISFFGAVGVTADKLQTSREDLNFCHLRPVSGANSAVQEMVSEKYELEVNIGGRLTGEEKWVRLSDWHEQSQMHEIFSVDEEICKLKKGAQLRQKYYQELRHNQLNYNKTYLFNIQHKVFEEKIIKGIRCTWRKCLDPAYKCEFFNLKSVCMQPFISDHSFIKLSNGRQFRITDMYRYLVE